MEKSLWRIVPAAVVWVCLAAALAWGQQTIGASETETLPSSGQESIGGQTGGGSGRGFEQLDQPGPRPGPKRPASPAKVDFKDLKPPATEVSEDTADITKPRKRGLVIALMPPIPDKKPENQADPHLRAYLGQLKGVDRIYEPRTADEFYEILANATRGGKTIDQLIILGHGNEEEPGVKLLGKNRLDMTDVDLEAIQNQIRDRMKVYNQHREAYCRAKAKNEAPSGESQRILKEWPAKVAELLQKMQRRRQMMDRVANSMSDKSSILMLNCYAASSQQHIDFLHKLGGVLMWRGGGRVTASTRRLDIKLMEGGQTGYGLVDHLIGSFNMIQAFVKTGQIVKPGDYYVSGKYVDYFNWDDYNINKTPFPPQAGFKPDQALLAEAASLKPGDPKCPEEKKKEKAPDKPTPAAAAPPKVTAGQTSGVFPAQPFNGLQLNYNASGVVVTETQDQPGFTTARRFKGRMGGGTVKVSGSTSPLWGTCNSEYGSFYILLSVRVAAGDQVKEYNTPSPCNRPGNAPRYEIKGAAHKFSLEVPYPAGQRVRGGFSIRLTFVNPRFGNRVLEVTGSFEAPE